MKRPIPKHRALAHTVPALLSGVVSAPPAAPAPAIVVPPPEPGPVPLRVLVCGGCDFDDGDVVSLVLDQIDRERGIGTVLCGEGPGVDRWAAAWAMKRGMLPEQYPISPFEKRIYGPKRAGSARNDRMLVLGRPHLVVVFPGVQRNVGDMLRRATSAGVEVIEVEGHRLRPHEYVTVINTREEHERESETV